METVNLNGMKSKKRKIIATFFMKYAHVVGEKLSSARHGRKDFGEGTRYYIPWVGVVFGS